MHQIINGRYDYKSKTYSHTQGYTPIIIHPGYEYESLSPYDLKNSQGNILENLWQFSKIYEKVYEIKTLSYIKGYRGKVLIWDHPPENHLIDGYPTDEYWNWREKGFNNEYAVRYPNGFSHRAECLGSYLKKGGHYYLLDYITARKKIYCHTHIDALVNRNTSMPNALEKFDNLCKRVKMGEKLNIIEVDGPTYTASKPYDMVKRGVLGKEGVDIMESTQENIVAALNNPNRPFGHGYVIAALIQNGEKWLK
jgi:hypothetical protein